MLNTKVDLNRLIELSDQISELEKIYKPLKEAIVEDMNNQKVSSLDHNGRKITLSIADRWSKLELSPIDTLEMRKLNLDYLIKTEFTLDKDLAQIQLKQGVISKATLERFCSIGTTKTLKIK